MMTKLLLCLAKRKASDAHAQANRRKTGGCAAPTACCIIQNLTLGYFVPFIDLIVDFINLIMIEEVFLYYSTSGSQRYFKTPIFLQLKKKKKTVFSEILL